jgi:hypothetical protein
MKFATRMIALTLFMVPLLAAAQMGLNEKITAKVPFEFVVGNKVFPAGQCNVQLTTSGTRLAIQNEKGVLYSNFVIDETKAAGAGYALVFHRYSDRTFLTGIKMEGSSMMYRLPESKAEAELQARNAPSIEKILLASRQ